MEPIKFEGEDSEQESLVKDIFKIFSDTSVTGDYPSKVQGTMDETRSWLSLVAISTIVNQGQTYSITWKKTGQIIGLIEVVFYERFSDNKKSFLDQNIPALRGSCEVEYWLNSNFWGNRIMSTILTHFTNNLLKFGALGVIAQVYTNNIASAKVLKRVGFTEIALNPQPNGLTYSFQLKPSWSLS